ncbi:hypothetical protein Tco_0564159 [Tanacetum coccineum]
MASNPEQVRLTVLTKLQEALDEEAILEEQILALMHRFADRFTDRRVEINNLMVLHDHPLIDYAFYGGDVYALRNGKGVDVFKELALEITVGNGRLILVIVGEFAESIEVFIPNENADKWDKIDDIGRHMIYIGDKTCLCMEAKTTKMENKIYFPRLHSGKIVFYSLETRKFHTYNGGNISKSFTYFSVTINHLPHNAWIEPAWS